MSAAEQGHRQLDAEVRSAVTVGAASPALANALKQHHDVLIAHLALEEGIVIPALLALSPDEFEDYTIPDIRGLLQRLEPQVQVPPAPRLGG